MAYNGDGENGFKIRQQSKGAPSILGFFNLNREKSVKDEIRHDLTPLSIMQIS